MLPLPFPAHCLVSRTGGCGRTADSASGPAAECRV